MRLAHVPAKPAGRGRDRGSCCPQEEDRPGNALVGDHASSEDVRGNQHGRRIGARLEPGVAIPGAMCGDEATHEEDNKHDRGQDHPEEARLVNHRSSVPGLLNGQHRNRDQNDAEQRNG